jgi:tetratricopeptide (TPR) repeat protein
MKILLLLIIIISIPGCADRHFLSINKTVTNDIMFNSVKVVVIDVELEEIPFTERQVGLNNSMILKKGKLKVDKKIVLNSLSESLSFDNKIVFTLNEYNKIKKDLNVIRPPAGYKEPRLHSLIRLKISYGIQTGNFERENKYRFFRKSRTCQYVKNPPKGYRPCVTNEDRTWDEIRLIKNATGYVDLLYSGEIYLNANGSFIHHKSINGYQNIKTPYQDEHAINQSIASGLGSIISNDLGLINLNVKLEIDEGNHNEAIDLLKQGQIELARKLLEEDVETNVFNSSTDYYNLGIIYHSYGDTKIAADYYGKAINAGGYKRMYVSALKYIKVLDEANILD